MFWLAIGIAVAGYCIGDGLKRANKTVPEQTHLISEDDLHLYFCLEKDEMKTLLMKKVRNH